MSSLPLFLPVPVSIQNPSFKDAGILPPPGWTPTSLTDVNLAYEVMNPYEGSQSLIVSVLSPNNGVVSAPFRVVPCQYLSLTAALLSASGDQTQAQILFYDFQGNLLPFTLTASTIIASWQLLTVSGYAPAYAVTAQIALTVNGGIGSLGEFDAISLVTCQASAYYVKLFTSQYQASSPKLLKWAQALLTPFMDAGICAASLFQNFQIDEAVGPQLDVLGSLLGITRTLPFTPSSGQLFQVAPTGVPFGSSGGAPPPPISGGGYVVGDVLNVLEAGASGGTIKVLAILISGAPTAYQILTLGNNYFSATNVVTSGGSGAGATVSINVLNFSPVLDDPTFRILLKAKVAFNQWNGEISSLYSIWQDLFPGGLIDVIDNQNMTATIILAGSFDPIIVDLINNGYIIPRPQGVQYTIAFPTLPVFGFDQNNAFVAGWDTGHWV